MYKIKQWTTLRKLLKLFVGNHLQKEKTIKLQTNSQLQLQLVSDALLHWVSEWLITRTNDSKVNRELHKTHLIFFNSSCCKFLEDYNSSTVLCTVLLIYFLHHSLLVALASYHKLLSFFISPYIRRIGFNEENNTRNKPLYFTVKALLFNSTEKEPLWYQCKKDKIKIIYRC